ncbi:membrane protein [Arenicella chitinivorans]|uniref:Membrane protein n=1 Tax=Arenicella chitinivorans TaxID=1329800 RepID=A0A918S247_9GAMM|nr:DMT family transporter [Arenicella chitinivorans]GHA20251.1 membrane protein [Arenicella chitinivorans]
MKPFVYTGLALIAFAGNSVLCRLALGAGQIDAASFTWIRLLSGIIVLAFILIGTRSQTTSSDGGSWCGAAALFVYALTFSYAYITLDTGVGALVLFGSVQLTMILAGFLRGHRPIVLEWFGLGLAFSGLIYLVSPELSTPSLMGFVLMVVSGIAWAIYTLVGAGSSNPLRATSFNFFRTTPFAVLILVLTITSAELSTNGVLLAVASGGVASALGYTLWYQALRSLTAIQAGVVQLLVPVIAAFGGVVFVGEAIAWPLVVASSLVLGGVCMVLLAKKKTV